MTPSQYQEEFCAFFGSRTIVPVSWMCKKQASVSHSSKEAEVISFDAGLRMMGFTLSDLWLSANTPPNMRKQIPTAHTNLDLHNIDHVPSNRTHSGCNAMLFAFEDNEAVIEIIKGRNPTMRHVSRTHRVALEWLFDRINLDSVIQIRYIDTKHQFADILTKGNFTRDEWNNLLHLFTNSHVSSICCAKKSRLISCAKTMAKRMQEQKEKERIVAKS